MENKWVIYVKKFAQKHNMTYGEALRCAKCKSAYKKKIVLIPLL